MAKTLVLEWDSRKARVIAIAQKGHKWSVEDAFAVALPAHDAAAGDKVVGPMLQRRNRQTRSRWLEMQSRRGSHEH